MFWSLALKKGFMKCDKWGPISKGIKRKDGRQHLNTRVVHITSHKGQFTLDSKKTNRHK